MGSFKQKFIALIVILGAALILIFQHGLYGNSTAPSQKQTASTQNNEIKVVSTNPVDQGTIMATQTVSVTFNAPIIDKDEVKHELTPAADYQVKLSDDRKTALFIPNKPWTLGTTYTIFIQPATKFDGKRTLGHDFILHFRTIDYHGV